MRTDSTLSLRRSLGKRVVDLVNHPYVTFKNTDCMAGSGSTGYVAVKNKRNFIGYELNTGFYEKAKARLDALMDSSSWDTDFSIL